MSGDYSSYMSATGFEPNLSGPLKCFNAASNREMGWFDDRAMEVYVHSSPVQIIPLAAFSEARKANKQDPIMITVGNYSLQYNFASEFNRGTEILQNLVTIAHSGTGKTIVEKDGLKPGGAVFTVEDYDGSGQTLKIEACDTIDGSEESPSAMVVGISLGLLGTPCEIQ